MEKDNKLVGVIVGILALATIVGVIVWAMNDSDNMADDTAANNTQQMEQQQTSNIVDLASETSELSTLVTALQQADLVNALEADGPFTVFAPSNSAFDALPEGTLDELLQPENREQLQAVLTYHVVPGNVMSADLSDGQVIETLNGATLRVDIGDDGVFLVDAQDNRVRVSTPDVNASNGVVHIIDSVLLP